MATERPAPVAHNADDRLEVIDAMRGVAILGIVFFNMPLAANSAWLVFHDIRAIGWSDADQWAYALLETAGEGTMRGMLQLLFGIGLMLFARKAMEPSAPVIYADLWMRRNMWLAAFGLFNVFVLLWPGDILFSYAVAALFLFPFRKLGPRPLLALGLGYLLVKVGLDFQQYADMAAAPPPTPGTEQPSEMLRRFEEHRAARDGGLIAEVNAVSLAYGYIWSDGIMRDWVVEAFFTMLIGMALFKAGRVGGERSRTFYGWATLVLYAFGLGVRWLIVDQAMTLGSAPTAASVLAKPARLALSIGHISLVLFLWKGAGRAALQPFVAAGRMAFTLYLMQSVIMAHVLFAPYGLDLWRRFGWFECALISLAITAAQLVIARWWLAHFRFGPLEWVWRSLTYWRFQPLARSIG